MSPKKQPTDENATFEQSLQQLAEIVDKLEGGDLPLDESVALFEKGMKLAKHSQALLQRAEKKVEELLAVEPDGSPITRPYEE
ncbi:MAG TPA: exodeoxyribonuclease VII small subunit [Polyangiaceae bacterium]|jgi:exodeoxyribonuclease VII small subunit|nr:MAG: Exodeoxyribonuclease 7 small subunit [Deltaproteobacteria bacterium ADurb.Bin207]HNS98969.1 exodeoxyribonuclease VII small subunit [Polyangiaceae bacterium]HNZ21208.1 exodeoxyribonuclease VII small subunit [Polyangiaceae bacterium]HOD21106.1 exodeoxyribonuclease VII small subunit [Polyangiaceae bacterium]HOE48046.1 exodeoxyribonuclease VII small subunit [Polyangiaceae bacterium]